MARAPTAQGTKSWVPSSILTPKEKGELAGTPLAPPPGQSQLVHAHAWYLCCRQQSPEPASATAGAKPPGQLLEPQGVTGK